MARNSKLLLAFVAAFALVSTSILPVAQGLDLAPAPAPASDGTTIDQGIAYVLMLLALVLTYIIHTPDVPLKF